MATPNINPRADGEGQFGESSLRWSYMYSDSIDGLQIYENGSRVALLASPTFTGVPLSTTPSSEDDTTKIATTAFVEDAVATRTFTIASSSGTGDAILVLPDGDNVNQSLDSRSYSTYTIANLLARGNHTGAQAQSTVTDLVSDLGDKAPLASPELTGTPLAPTASASTNTTQIATTAYADTAATASVARSSHTGSQAQSTITDLVSDLGDKAPLASPTLTGTPVAPTASASTNSTQIATTAYTDAAVAASTGTNTADIATNTTNIETNETDITALQKGAFSILDTVADAGSKNLANSDMGSLIVLGSASTLALDSVTQVGYVSLIDTGATASEITWSTSTVKDVQGTELTSPHTLASNALLVQYDASGGEYILEEFNGTHTQAQSTITDLVADLALKAPLASPDLTGVPTSPTAATTTDTTQVANTAFVQQELSAEVDYAEIYVTAGSTAQTTNGTGDTFDTITGFNTAQGVDGHAVTSTPAKATNKITVGQTSKYLVSFSCSFTGVTASTYAFQLYNSTQTAVYGNCKSKREVLTGTLTDSVSFSGIINATASDDIVARVACDETSKAFTPLEMSLTITKL